MKFAEHLGAHLTPEWRKQYILYEEMKQMLYAAIEQAPSQEVTDMSSIQRFFTRFDEHFLQFCDKELTKINTFFAEKLAEASRRYASLKSELQLYTEQTDHGTMVLKHRRINMNTMLLRNKKRNEGGSRRKMNDLKLAFSEFYLSLILLQNYQKLNFQGFRKILKKHDKLISSSSGMEWRQAYVESALFYTCQDVDLLIKDTEQVVINNLEGGNRQKAMKRLRVPPLGEQSSIWTTFRLGLFSGIFLAIIIVIVLAVIHVHHTEAWTPVLQMFRGSLLVILHCSLIGINTYGWRSSGVNHVLIFELDPRSHLSHQQILELASFLAMGWGLGVLMYLFSSHLGIPLFTSPLTFTCILLAFTFNPFHILYFNARMWLLKVLFRIFTAPFHSVGFADFWLADQLNSLVAVFLDLEYLVCYYSFEVDWLGDDRPSVCTLHKYGIRAIFSCLPAWFRFAQCLRRYYDTKHVYPHIANAGKYATTFVSVFFSTLYHSNLEYDSNAVRQTGAYFYLWIVAKIISSCYTLTWDIKMDWGLLSRDAGENRFLREEFVYSHKAYYYLAMLEDMVLRFAWCLTATVGEAQLVNPQLLSTVLSCLEVFRRFVWNFFRLENEHLNNCGEFRAVRDISITPIESNDLALLTAMMDDPEGTQTRRTNRRRKHKKKDRTCSIEDERDELLDGPSINT